MKDGGPAFPQMDGYHYVKTSSGMSLRDYFAGQAICAPWGEALGVDNQGVTNDPDTFAANCYAIADAMLKAREAQA